MAFTPYILSFFSNPPVGEAGHLFYINEERDALEKKFQFSSVKPVPVTDKLDKEKVAESVKLLRNQYTVIHYSGHADSFSLELSGEQLRADNFIEFVSLCPSLKLVVLNGCSTQGFVKRLLEATAAKAVIATPRPVDDDRAMKFSVNFYNNLLLDLPVEKAFTVALAETLEQQYKPNANVFKVNMEDDVIQGMEVLSEKTPGTNERGIKKAGAAVMNDREGTTWGLYVKEVQALEWRLFATGEEDAARKEDISKQLVMLDAAIFKLEVEEKDLVEENASLQKDYPDDARIRKVIARNEQDIEALKATLQKNRELKAALLNRAIEKNDEELILRYVEAIKNLNFTQQKNYIDDIAKKNLLAKVTGFILHADSQSCLNHLTRKLVYWLGINDINAKAIFDYDSPHQADDFWKKLAIDFDLKSPGDDPLRLVEEIQSRYRDKNGQTKGSFVLVFRNNSKDLFADADMRKKIFEFWEIFTAHFLAVDKGHTVYSHGVYLFLIDDQCTLIESPPSFMSSRENEYKLFESDKQPGQASIKLVPTVIPVTAPEIPKWESEYGIPQNYRYTPADLTDIIGKTGGQLLPTIREISSRRIQTKARKNWAYQSFVDYIKNPL